MPYKSRYFELAEDSAGAEFVICADEVLMIPLASDGQIVFVREPAPAFARETPLLLPGGTVEDGEDLAVTANRELQEEIGYRADQLDLLAELRPWTKYLRVRSHIFLAQCLQPARLDGDEGYVIELEPHPLAALDDLIHSGALRDARAIAALLIARQRLAAR
ncbi:MAG TPA: NUDIX domain-containing protein [Ktedonobacterales bacterium]|nr:NUDIX domain-containing protein [Ktedonobacterales bacterium]